MHKWLDVLPPFRFLLPAQSTEHAQLGAVEPLDRVPSWMVRGGMRLFYAGDNTKLLNQFRLKVKPLVSVESFWDSKIDNEIIPQAPSYRLGLLVGSWYSDSILRKMIC